MHGRYTVKYHDIKTGKRWKEVFDNTLTVGFWNAIFAFLNEGLSAPDVDALDVTHLGLGDGTTASMASDTLLENEIFRKAVSYRAFSTVKFTAETSIAAAEGNPTGEYIKELGIFTKATDTPDSGLMISRANVNIYKTASLAIIIVWELSY